jgi:hypothetical protein
VGNGGIGWMAISQKRLEFHDEIELPDTGQYGWQRFRKPLLNPVVRKSVERVDFELDVSRGFKKYLF